MDAPEGRPATVAVEAPAELVEKARALGIDVEAALASALRDATEKERGARAWLTENAEALAAQQRRIEREGLPLAQYRTWEPGD